MKDKSRAWMAPWRDTNDAEPRPSLSMLVRSIPDRLRRNPEFLQSVRDLILASSPREREAALDGLAVWLLRKQIERESSKGLAWAKGFAGRLAEQHTDLIAHAKHVSHLGALAPLAKLPATRLDYASILLRVLCELKEQQPGLGLATKNFGIRHGAEELTGLEIAQSWTLLAGYGHMFGTFSTERAFLFALASDPAAERKFITQVDASVREDVEGVIRARDMYRCFYAVAAWRVSRWRGSDTRMTCLQLLARLIQVPTELKWQRLGWAFRRARQLAYTRLHAMLGPEFPPFSVPISRAVRELRPLSQIGFISEQEEVAGAVLELVDAMDRFYGKEFFTSPAASERVLSHLREFKHWWASRSSEAIEDKVEALMLRPDDWPTSPPLAREHFVRLDVPSGGVPWTNEVDSWLKAPPGTWEHANFLITPTRRASAGCITVDVFADGPPRCAVVAHVASLLAVRNEATWLTSPPSTDSKRLWRSIAALGLHLFQLLLKPEYLVHLEPMSATDGIGLALLARSTAVGCGRLGDFARRVDDEARRLELDALREAALTVDADRGPWLTFLGRVRILQRDTGRSAHEFDGVFAFFEADCIEWHFIEHKDGDASGLRGQMEKVASLLKVDPSPAVPIKVSRGRAGHCVVSWRSPADQP